MTVSISRRRFITALPYLAALALSGALFFRLYRAYRAGYTFDTVLIKIFSHLRFDEPLDPEERLDVERYIDALVPDDITPGAVAAGVGDKIFAQCERDPDYRRLLREGLMRINRLAEQTAGIAFHLLTLSQADHLLKISSTAGGSSPEFRLLERLRTDTFRYYYADPAHWGELCFPGPPQPAGFLQPHLPPAVCNFD